MPIETPIKNLFTIGDACKNVGMAGSSGAADSGARAANAVLKMIKK
jgi:thioredoxin reductase